VIDFSCVAVESMKPHFLLFPQFGLTALKRGLDGASPVFPTSGRSGWCRCWGTTTGGSTTPWRSWTPCCRPSIRRRVGGLAPLFFFDFFLGKEVLSSPLGPAVRVPCSVFRGPVNESSERSCRISSPQELLNGILKQRVTRSSRVIRRGVSICC